MKKKTSKNSFYKGQAYKHNNRQVSKLKNKTKSVPVKH